MTDPNDILKSILVSIMRHLLGIAAAYLVSKGLVSPEIASESNLLVLAGGIVALAITVGWIIVNKLRTRNLVAAAHEASPSTPMSIVKTDAADMPLWEGVK